MKEFEKEQVKTVGGEKLMKKVMGVEALVGGQQGQVEDLEVHSFGL